MKNRKILLRTLYALALFGFLCLLALLGANVSVMRCDKRIADSTDTVPEREYGVLLGTSKIIRGKYINYYFIRRIKAAADLYHAGKIHKIIVSGDNSHSDYNEPEDMRQELIQAGVPETDIICDYGGRRTLDSIVRAHTVFGCDSFTVISQRAHCRRAIFIADGNGIDAIGFAAEDVSRRYQIKQWFREPAACLLAWLDVKLLHRKPHFEH